VLSAPLFEKVTIRLANGRQLVIEGKGLDGKPETNKYIQSVSLNGKQLDRLWIRHEDIAKGAHLVFVVGATPNKNLGADESKMPPSLTA
jgi:putative alpha-1,2-mannosidase